MSDETPFREEIELEDEEQSDDEDEGEDEMLEGQVWQFVWFILWL